MPAAPCPRPQCGRDAVCPPDDRQPVPYAASPPVVSVSNKGSIRSTTSPGDNVNGGRRPGRDFVPRAATLGAGQRGSKRPCARTWGRSGDGSGPAQDGVGSKLWTVWGQPLIPQHLCWSPVKPGLWTTILPATRRRAVPGVSAPLPGPVRRAHPHGRSAMCASPAARHPPVHRARCWPAPQRERGETRARCPDPAPDHCP